jgi:hypothetical protein
VRRWRTICDVVIPVLETAVQANVASVASASRTETNMERPRARKPRCEDCFFHCNMLCALPEKKPCPTFRPAHPDGLKPPQQLSFVFRQERRTEPFVFQPAGA